MPGHTDHVVVVGSDSTVVRLSQELEQAGEEIVLIADASTDSEVIDDVEAHGADVISTRTVTESDLIAAGITEAKAAVVMGAEDVSVIKISLAIEELNPDVRLVLGLSDPRLGARLRPVLGEVEIVSIAELAAPSFVAAALATSDAQTFELGGRLLAAGPRSMIGGEQLAVIGNSAESSLEEAVLPEGGGDVVLGTELTGHAGDGAKVSGTLGAFARVFDRRLRLVLIGLLVLIVVSAIYFRVVGLDWLEALYVAFTASTDTGIWDTDEELGLGFQFGAVVIQFFGLMLSSGITAVIIDALLTSRLDELSGGLRGRPRDHVIVCGLGRIGAEVAVRLRRRGVSVVGVEVNEDAVGLPRARREKIPVVIGPANDEAVLDNAGVSRADVVLALTDDDSANLEIGLVAQQAEEDVRVVTRMFDHDLAVRVERRLRLGSTRSVSMLAAPAFAAAALGRYTRVIFPIGRWVMIFAEIGVQAGSRAVGMPVDAFVERGASVVLALRRADEDRWRWHPGGEEQLAAGDQIAVGATRDGLSQLLFLTKPVPVTGGIELADQSDDPPAG